jgi:hypothetical protein
LCLDFHIKKVQNQLKFTTNFKDGKDILLDYFSKSLVNEEKLFRKLAKIKGYYPELYEQFTDLDSSDLCEYITDTNDDYDSN